MMRFGLLVCCFMLCKIELQTQNLIPNPSFEDKRGKRPSMYPWQMINTVDFFIYDERKKKQELRTKIRDKNFKLRPARTGKAYVGFRVWPRYRYTEFLYVQLPQTLKKNTRYYFEMYICISPYANAYLKSIGASFYPFKPPYSQRSIVSKFPPQITIYNHSGLIDTTDWFKVSGVFTAEGNEIYMYIGNFNRKNSVKLKRRRFGFGKREAYYYIDDVALYKLDEYGFPLKEARVIDKLEKDTYNIITPIQIIDKAEVEQYYKSIDFPSESSKFTYESYKKLAYVVNFLLSNPLVQIYVIGYAGKNGNIINEEKVKLAQRRVRNISNFISGNKINRNRINLKYSITDCIDSNAKNQQLLNRCNSVEILFSNDPEDMKRVNSPLFRLMP